MASWKKVLVSGSSIEVAAITASVVPTGTTENVVLVDGTGKFNQITQGALSSALGSYNFTASADTGTPAGIDSGNIFRVLGGNGMSTSFAKSTTTGSVTVTLNTGSTHFLSGVSKEVFEAGNFVDSSEIDFTVTPGASVTAALINGSIANARLVNSAITIGSTSTALGATSTTIAGLVSLFSQNITGSAISASGALTAGTVTSAGTISTTSGNITTTTGYIKAGSPGGAPDSPGAVEGVLGYFTSATIGTLGVTGNTTITGDLTVNGTTTTINSTNLLISDKFVLFASGSDASTDGGIIVQQGTTTGYAFAVDASADRWALQNNLGPTATSITPDSYLVSAVGAAGGPSAAPVYGGASFGYGNIHVNTSTEEIFIYS